MFKHKKFLTGAAITALALGATAATVTAATNPYEKPNQSDITITGEVLARVGDELTLDYGEGVITVEMDDWDWHNEAAWINPGEKITVSGEIDNDLYQIKTIEAETAYVHDRATYYYASDTDEEDRVYWTYTVMNPSNMPEGTWLGLSGTVTEMNGSEFTMDTGYNEVRVETAYLDYNPLDDQGYQQVDTGDRVYVSGLLDKNFFTRNEVDASTLITLTEDAKTSANN